MTSSAFKLYRSHRTKILLMSPCILLIAMYLFNVMAFKYKVYDDSVIDDGFLILNSKCHMFSKVPYDPSILKFIEKVKYENCSKSPLLTSVIQDENGRNMLVLNTNETSNFKSIFCCWSSIIRPIPEKPKPKENFDSSITVQNCIEFNSSFIVPKEVDTLLVSCKYVKNKHDKLKKRLDNHLHSKSIYQNVHSVINVEKVLDRFNFSNVKNVTVGQRKLSVLLLGIDNVSRLNFYRNLPETMKYLDEKGWLLMKGYNKMGYNTYPNLMAILTGQEEKDARDKCTPEVPFGLDNCPMLWYNFKNAGYATAYAEDEANMTTFNFLKVGFVDPPTDYYLRPYILATEKLLKTRTKFVNYYCTGPELATERILNSAVDFAIRFIGLPYFGFFWTNSVTHDSLNSLSSMDTRILSKLEHLEKQGVMNDTMIIFLSDHGVRIGEFRKTFMGWYEERLPFFYIWLPEWFRRENPEAYQALAINQNRLTSPFDLYETLRDIIIRAGGDAAPSSGCPKCTSLFKTVPFERGCDDAGVPTHWCVCSVFEKESKVASKVIVQGAHKIVDHIENIVKDYKTKEGKRLCSKLKLMKISRFNKVLSLNDNLSTSTEYYYAIELSPGNGKFEATVHYYGSGNYSIIDEQISRTNSYRESAKCLEQGQKRYCHCTE